MRAPLQVVAPVDLKRYAGLWHEQARLPNRFEKQCTGPVTAEYTLLDDGTRGGAQPLQLADGSFDESVGSARVVPVAGQPGAGRLEVRFAPDWLRWLPMVWGDYWILKLDRDYQVALVGTPNREYLWVLSRVPQLDAARCRPNWTTRARWASTSTRWSAPAGAAGAGHRSGLTLSRRLSSNDGR